MTTEKVLLDTDIGSGIDVAVCLAYAEVWFERTDQVTFHDPLAAAPIFAPDICTFTRCSVDVETASPRVRGMTYFAPDEEGPHESALAVDPPKYWDHLFKTFQGKGDA